MSARFVSREDRRRRIQEIPIHIKALAEELERLILQGVLDEREDNSVIIIGDKIIIKNNHLGLQGSSGTVVAETRTKYRIRLENGSHIYRAKKNVEKTP